MASSSSGGTSSSIHELLQEYDLPSSDAPFLDEQLVGEPLDPLPRAASTATAVTVTAWRHCHTSVPWLEALAVRLTLLVCESILEESSASLGPTTVDNSTENSTDDVATATTAAAATDGADKPYYGIMIAAGHLPEAYNGLEVFQSSRTPRIIHDVHRSILVGGSPDQLMARLPLVVHHTIYHNRENCRARATLHLGRDTRTSSEELARIVRKTAETAGICVVDHGEVPTPYLRYCVCHDGHDRESTPPTTLSHATSPTTYYAGLANAYATLINHAPLVATAATRVPDNSLLIDCAGGIAYLGVRECVLALQERQVYRRMVASNRIGPSSAPLNQGCGAVHVLQEGNTTWYNNPPIGKSHCAALTGDASRVIFFYQPSSLSATDHDNPKVVVIPPDVMLGWMARHVHQLLATDTPDIAVAIVVAGTSGRTDGIEESVTSSVCVLQQHAGPRIQVVRSEDAPNDKHQSWDVTIHYSTVTNETRVTWNTSSLVVHQTSDNSCARALPTLLPCYPDGLAHLLLVDALLRRHNQTLADICS